MTTGDDMPLKSKAQYRKYYAMAERGEITEGQLREAIRKSPPLSELPERVKRKKGKKK